METFYKSLHIVLLRIKKKGVCAMAKTITVSFKENTKEMKLYATVNAMEDKSGWVKEVIMKALLEEEFKEAKS